MFANLLTFAEALTAADGGLSLYQRGVVKAYAGMPLSREEASAWRRATGRSGLSSWMRGYRQRSASELWLLTGRRGGKTTLGSILVLWTCITRTAPESQTWTIPVITPGLRQSKSVSLDLIRRKLAASPELLEFLANDTLDSLEFTTGMTVRVLPPDPRLVQGFTSPLVWLDEASNFRGEDALSNLQDVLDAVRPSLATVLDSKLVLTSLPGPKAGCLWETWQNRFDLDALIFKASSVEMNPALARSEEFVKALKRPEYFALYFSGEFVDAVQTLLPGDLVDACFDLGRPEVPSGESGGALSALGCDFAATSDDCAAAICTRTEHDQLVVPWLRSWSVSGGKLHPITTYLGEIFDVAKAHNVREGVGDQVALPTAAQFFTERGIPYSRLVTNGVASEAIFDFLREAVRSGRLHLPDNEKLRAQLKALQERRANGYEVAAVRGKDDLAVAVAAAVFKAGQLPVCCQPMTEFLDLGDRECWQRIA